MPTRPHQAGLASIHKKWWSLVQTKELSPAAPKVLTGSEEAVIQSGRDKEGRGCVPYRHEALCTALETASIFTNSEGKPEFREGTEEIY